MFKRGQFVYRKGQCVDNVYYLLKGDVLRVEENHLDLNYILNVKYKKDDIKCIIAHLIRKKLILCQPEIYARMALKRFTAIGRQKYFNDDVETDENFCRLISVKSS